MNQTYKARLTQYAVEPSLPTWGDLEGCSLKAMMFEKYPSISPYTYCANNPMKYVDPTGETFGDYVDVCGNYLGNDGKLDGKVYLVTDPCDIEIIEENDKVDGTTPKDGVSSAIDLQAPPENRTEAVDYVIDNDGPDNITEFGGIVKQNNNDGSFFIEKGVGEKWKGSPHKAIFNYKNELPGEFKIFFHGHFQGKFDGIGVDQFPGDEDMKNAGDQSRSTVLNIVISKQDNAVYIYNTTGYYKMSIGVFKTVKNTHTPLR